MTAAVTARHGLEWPHRGKGKSSAEEKALDLMG